MYIVKITKEGSARIINFLSPVEGVLMPGRGHISHIVNIHYLLLHQYTTHWLLLYSEVKMLHSYAIVDFYLFYNGAVDIQVHV